MSQAALTLARVELSTGALLIHGALAEVPERSGGGGILLAGPCTVGKTTASNRLPPPWHSLSDDASLILPDNNGQYYVHPWPTWSRFYNAKGDFSKDDTWDVQRGLPLRAIFFLTQSSEDRITFLPTTFASTCIFEAVRHVSRIMSWNLSTEQVHLLHKRIFDNVESLIRVIPTYKLHISLNGTFWKNIEEILASQGTVRQTVPFTTATKEEKSVLHDKELENGTFVIGLTGTSMQPTLRPSDLLKIEPYQEHLIKRGDIIYFQPPSAGPKTVHRIVKITRNNIITRGDNNRTNDSHPIKKEAVIGRVTRGWRHGNSYDIYGGHKGIWIGYYCRFRHWMYHSLAPFFRKSYIKLSTSTLLKNLIPTSLHPQAFEFKQRLFPSRLKLMVKGRVIGQYNYKLKLWQIKAPWQLIVDETLLPKVK